jgi:hypothetical protein
MYITSKIESGKIWEFTNLLAPQVYRSAKSCSPDGEWDGLVSSTVELYRSNAVYPSRSLSM